MCLSLRIGFIALCLLVPSIAAADVDFGDFNFGDYDVYVGAEPGRTTLTPTFGDLSISNDLGLIIPDEPGLKGSSSSSLSSTSSRVEAGFWIDRYVGLQISYLDLGTFSQTSHLHSPHSDICYGDCSLYHTSDLTETNKVSVNGVVLAVIGRVSLPEGFELLGRLGLFQGNVRYEEDSSLAPSQLDGSDTISSSAGDIGLGLGWQFSSHWGVELWRDRFTKMGNTMSGNSIRESQFDVKGYSLALQYHF